MYHLMWVYVMEFGPLLKKPNLHIQDMHYCEEIYGIVRQDNYGRWGVVVRDEEGLVISAAAGCSDGIHDEFMAELKAMEAAVNQASSLGATRVVFQTDPQLLMYAMNSPAVDFSPAAPVI